MRQVFQIIWVFGNLNFKCKLILLLSAPQCARPDSLESMQDVTSSMGNSAYISASDVTGLVGHGHNNNNNINQMNIKSDYLEL